MTIFATLLLLYLCAFWVLGPAVNDQLEQLKSQIDGEVKTGQVRLAFLPLSVYVDDVEVKRAGKPLFGCKKLSVRFSISLWPLRVKPQRATIYRPTLHLEQLRDGTTNLAGLFKSSKGSSGHTPRIIVRHGLLRVSSPWLAKIVSITSLTMNVEDLNGRIHFDLKGQPEFYGLPPFARTCSVQGSLTSLKDVSVSLGLQELWLKHLPQELSGGVSHSRPLTLTGIYARRGTSITLKASEDRGHCALTIPGLSTPLRVEGLSLNMKRELPKAFVGVLTARICGGTLTLEPKEQSKFAVTGTDIDAKALTELVALPGFSLAGPLQIEGEVSSKQRSFNATVCSSDLRFFYQRSSGKVIGAVRDFGVGISGAGERVAFSGLKGNLNDELQLSGSGHYERSGEQKSYFAIQCENVTESALDKIISIRQSQSPHIPVPEDPVTVKIFIERSKEKASDKYVIEAKETRLRVQNGTIPLHKGYCRIVNDKKRNIVKLFSKLETDGVATVELNGNFPKDSGALSVQGEKVHCAALTKMLPWPKVVGAGRLDFKTEANWKNGITTVSATLSIGDKAFFKVPRALFEKGETGLFRASLGPSKAVLDLKKDSDGLSFKLKDALATFRHGGRLSLSADYENKKGRKLIDLDFKLAEVSLPTLLDFVDVDDVKAKGKGTVYGNYLYKGGDTKLHCRASFPGAELYSFPLSKFTTEFVYSEDKKGKKLQLKSLNALTHNDGKISASGTNTLAPVVKPEIRFMLANIDAKRLCKLAEIEGFSGRGRLRVEGLLEGTIWRPKVKMLIKCPSLKTYFKAGGKGFQQSLGNLSVSAWLQKKKGGWRIEITKSSASAFGGTLSVNGPLQLSPKPSSGLKLKLSGAKAKQLAKFLAIQDFSLAGALSVDGVLKGALDDVCLSARVVIKNARLFYKLEGFNILYEPSSIATNLRIEKGKILLKDTRGTYHGGAFVMDLARYSGKTALWKGAVKFHAVDLNEFFKSQLQQENNIKGLVNVQVTFKGSEGLADSFSGMGSFSVKKGKIIELAELRRIESEYKLRNLIGIAFNQLRSKVKLVKSRLAFYDLVVKSTRGNAKGKVGVSFNKKLDGTLSVSLDRSVLSKGHRLLSLIEGGRYFDFKVHLSGTTDEPRYNFSSRGVKNGAIIGGAALFTPLAPAAVIFTGIKKLFGRKRRSK